MKILWFTNTPCSANEKLNIRNNLGGWLSSLEQELTKHKTIDLHIAFYHTDKIDSFFYNNTWFYPVKRKRIGSKVQRYFARLFKWENNDRFEIKQLISIVEQVKPDLIHIHGTEDNFGLIQYHTHIPVIVSIQGILSPIMEKFFSGIPQIIANRQNSLRSRILKKTSKYIFQRFKQNSSREREILKISKIIIGRTDWDKRVTRILAPQSKYYAVQEMLRPSFYENSWGKTKFGKKIQIITVSSDGFYKGFETIVKTANVLSLYTKIDFEWLVVGLHKESEIVLLVQKWLKLNSENIHIKLLGKKNELEIVDLLLSADIFCQVSHIENSPNSLCEAMIIGVPIIATYAGGTNSMLENEKEGILVQDGDQYSLAGAILELSSDFDKAKHFAHEAKLRAIKRHDKNNIVSKIINLYQDKLN